LIEAVRRIRRRTRAAARETTVSSTAPTSTATRTDTVETAASDVSPGATTGGNADNLLNARFREVLLAALLFDCGDRDGAARAILQAYRKDVHGHFAAYATAALDGRLRESP
jgi:hypothetical protein